MVHPESSPITFLDALQSTDEKLLKAIYVGNYPGVERFITQNNGNTDDARDIYQEAFLAVWRNVRLQRFSPADEQEYAAYLFRVAKNKWIDQLRANKHKYMVALTNDEQLSPANGTDQQETDQYIDAVKKHYTGLGEKCRELLSMFYFQKLSLKKIAAFFSWTEPSAKNNKYRCIKQLRELIINKGK